MPETTAYLYESPLDGSLQTNQIAPDSTDTPAAVSVTLAQSGGVATATTSAASGYQPGDWVLILGASDARYNGWFQVATVPTSTTFTYAVPSGTSSSGTGTAQAMVAWKTASAISRSSTTVTVTVANSFTTGQSVSIAGVTQPEYDGWFIIASASSTQFTFTVASTVSSTPSGSVIRVHVMNDQTQTTFDLAGEPLTMTDPRGVGHEYFYNNDGQQTQDNVTSFGTSGDVSETVNQIDTCYDDIGRVHKITSEGVVDETEAVLNQIQYAYDGWGNEIQEWQALTGSVDTESTPSVQYTYSSPLPSGEGEGEGVMFVRLSAMIYPNGREVDYGYGETTSTPTFAQTVDNIMSRLATISDSSGTLATYTWLGVGTIASQTDNQPEISLDYSGSNFAALDRFGNI